MRLIRRLLAKRVREMRNVEEIRCTAAVALAPAHHHADPRSLAADPQRPLRPAAVDRSKRPAPGSCRAPGSSAPRHRPDTRRHPPRMQQAVLESVTGAGMADECR